MGKAPAWLRGIWSAVHTPFSPDNEEVSLDHLARNLNMGLLTPVQGFAVLTPAGEAESLLFEEKMDIVAAAVRAAEERPVLAGTGAHSTLETVALTLAAAERGARAALVRPPALRSGQGVRERLREHYLAVAEAGSLPILIHDDLGLGNAGEFAELILELADHPAIVGVLLEGGDFAKLDRILREAPEGFAVLTGCVSLLLPALRHGAVGGILPLAGVAGWECTDILRLYEEGDDQGALQMQRRLSVVEEAIRPHGVPALKALADMVGYYGGPPRRPLEPIDPYDLDEIRATLRNVRLLGC